MLLHPIPRAPTAESWCWSLWMERDLVKTIFQSSLRSQNIQESRVECRYYTSHESILANHRVPNYGTQFAAADFKCFPDNHKASSPLFPWSWQSGTNRWASTTESRRFISRITPTKVTVTSKFNVFLESFGAPIRQRLWLFVWLL